MRIDIRGSRESKYRRIGTIDIESKPVAINARFAGNYHTTSAYKKAKEAIHFEAKSKWHIEVSSYPLSLEIQMGQGRADIDAYIKIILDALQGVVYENDRQVKKLSVEII